MVAATGGLVDQSLPSGLNLLVSLLARDWLSLTNDAMLIFLLIDRLYCLLSE